MSVRSYTFRLNTRGFNDTHDLTKRVQSALDQSNLTAGIVTVFVSGSTAGVTTIEFEAGVIEDLNKAIERLAPQNIHYDHDARWGDGNGFSHVRSALLGTSLTVPFANRELRLGKWQQIVLIDFDNRSRTREIIIQILGE